MGVGVENSEVSCFAAAVALALGPTHPSAKDNISHLTKIKCCVPMGLVKRKATLPVDLILPDVWRHDVWHLK